MRVITMMSLVVLRHTPLLEFFGRFVSALHSNEVTAIWNTRFNKTHICCVMLRGCRLPVSVSLSWGFAEEFHRFLRWHWCHLNILDSLAVLGTELCVTALVLMLFQKQVCYNNITRCVYLWWATPWNLPSDPSVNNPWLELFHWNVVPWWV